VLRNPRKKHCRREVLEIRSIFTVKSIKKRKTLINNSAFIFHFTIVILLLQARIIKFYIISALLFFALKIITFFFIYIISAILFFALNVITFFFIYIIGAVLFFDLNFMIFFFYITRAVLFSVLLLFALLPGFKLFNCYILFRLISFTSTSRGNLSLPRSRGISLVSSKLD